MKKTFYILALLFTIALQSQTTTEKVVGITIDGIFYEFANQGEVSTPSGSVTVTEITPQALAALSQSQIDALGLYIQVAPSGYTATINQTEINESNQTAVSFTFATALVGAIYNYTFTSSAGGTPVTGTGTVTSATQTISGINLTGLTNGTITLSVSLSDSYVIFGNTVNLVGTAVTTTRVKNTAVVVAELLLTGTLFNLNGGGSILATAMDRDIATFYASNDANSGGNIKRVGLDLGSGNEKSITRVRFYPRGAFETRMHNVDIEISTDGINYTTVANTGTNAVASQWYEYDFTNTAVVRYIRFTKTPDTTSFNFSEFEVYGQ